MHTPRDAIAIPARKPIPKCIVTGMGKQEVAYHVRLMSGNNI